PQPPGWQPAADQWQPPPPSPPADQLPAWFRPAAPRGWISLCWLLAVVGLGLVYPAAVLLVLVAVVGLFSVIGYVDPALRRRRPPICRPGSDRPPRPGGARCAGCSRWAAWAWCTRQRCCSC